MRPLPPLFATRRSNHTVELWNAHLVERDIHSNYDHWNHQPGAPVYRITAHTLHSWGDRLAPPGLLRHEPVPQRDTHVVLIADVPRHHHHHGHRYESDTIYRGPWRDSQRFVHSWFHPVPIPVLEFENTREWPADGDNRMQVVIPAAGPADLRPWIRRWRAPIPESDDEDEEEPPRQRRRAPAPAPAAAAAPSTVAATATAVAAAPPPKFVGDALIAAAVASAAACPITLEPITPESAAATSCFHVFDANAIASWLASDDSHGACPTCKAPGCRVIV